MRRSARRHDAVDRLPRVYVDAGVATLLLGAVGAADGLASQVFRAASGAAVALVGGALA